MKLNYLRVSECGTPGYWFKEGAWRSVLTGEELGWASFGPESTYSSCATVDTVFSPGMGTFKKDHCQTRTCPVCLVR